MWPDETDPLRLTDDTGTVDRRSTALAFEWQKDLELVWLHREDNLNALREKIIFIVVHLNFYT